MTTCNSHAPLRTEYPSLGAVSIEFEYRPDETLDDQADEFLAPVIKLCKDRVDTARQDRAILKKKADRAHKERKWAKKQEQVKALERDRQRMQNRLGEKVNPKNHQEQAGRMQANPLLDKLPSHPIGVASRAITLDKTGIEESAAKPRDLLESFSLASLDDLNDEDNETGWGNESSLKQKTVHWRDFEGQDNAGRKSVPKEKKRMAFGQSSREKTGKPRDLSTKRSRSLDVALTHGEEYVLQLNPTDKRKKSSSRDRPKESKSKHRSRSSDREKSRSKSGSDKVKHKDGKLRSSGHPSTGADKKARQPAAFENESRLTKPLKTQKPSSKKDGLDKANKSNSSKVPKEQPRQDSARSLIHPKGAAKAEAKTASSKPVKKVASHDVIRRSTEPRSNGASKSTHAPKVKPSKVEVAAPSTKRSREVKSTQVSGISSMERAPKSRRRKKTQTAPVGKSHIEAFGDDCSFRLN